MSTAYHLLLVLTSITLWVMKYIVRSSSITSRTLPIEMGDYQFVRLVKELKDNPGSPIVISSLLPESRQQRRYLEGGLIPLFVFFQGNDYTDLSQIASARADILKEVLGVKHTNAITGEMERVAQSSKGRENLNKVIEWLVDYMVVNFDCPYDAMDPEKHKYWRDVTYGAGGPDDYVTYLLEVGILRKPI